MKNKGKPRWFIISLIVAAVAMFLECTPTFK